MASRRCVTIVIGMNHEILEIIRRSPLLPVTLEQ